MAGLVPLILWHTIRIANKMDKIGENGMNAEDNHQTSLLGGFRNNNLLMRDQFTQ